jgi:hypothetical protein
MDTRDGITARPLEAESNGKEEASIPKIIDSLQFPSDLLLAHNAAVSCIRLAMQLHGTATSGVFDEKATVEMLVALEKRLLTARPLILAVSKKLSNSQLSFKARGWFNGQPINEENAHQVALESAFSLYVGCWGAGDPRGLARALAGRASRAWTEPKGIITIDPEVIRGRSKHIRAYLCAVGSLAGDRLVKAMQVEVEEAAKRDRETAPVNLIRKSSIDHSSTTSDANVNGSDLFAASHG